jgi:hypothetical protein
MRCHGTSSGRRVRNGNDQPDLTSKPLRQGDALQLRGAQLSLEVAQSPLDLNEEHIGPTGEDHVSGTPVRRQCHGNLQPHLPRGMRRRPDLFREGQLTRIAETNSVGWVEPN